MRGLVAQARPPTSWPTPPGRCAHLPRPCAWRAGEWLEPTEFGVSGKDDTTVGGRQARRPAILPACVFGARKGGMLAAAVIAMRRQHIMPAAVLPGV